MVIAAASTGNASSSRKAVTSIDHTNSGILCSVMPGARMLKLVLMKLTAPRIEDAPARRIEQMIMLTDMQQWHRGPGSTDRKRVVLAKSDCVRLELDVNNNINQQYT